MIVLGATGLWGLGGLPGFVGTLGVVALVGLGAAFRGKVVDRGGVWRASGVALSTTLRRWAARPEMCNTVATSR